MTDVRRTKTPTETINTSVSHLLGFDCVAAEKALLVRPSVMQCRLDSSTFHRMGLCVRSQCSHIVIKKKNLIYLYGRLTRCNKQHKGETKRPL